MFSIAIPSASAQIRPSRITREDFIRFVDWAYEASVERRQKSRFSRFKQAWKDNAKTRLVVWAGLLASSAAAVASWAAVAAGSILAARVAMSAVGGYFASEAAFDLVAERVGKNPFSRLLRAIETAKTRAELDPLVREIFSRYEEGELSFQLEAAQKRASLYEGVKKVSAATVGSVLALLWASSSAEAAATSVQSVTSETRSRALSVLASNPSPALPAPVTEIFNDIRHDHPGQKYVTLEQSVRRIEGLSRGIPLSQSENLAGLNASVSAAVHDPFGKIATAMKELWYLASNQTVDEAARRMSEEKIQAVLERAYAIQDGGVPAEIPEPVQTPVSEQAPNPAEAPAAPAAIPAPAPAPDTPVPSVDSIPVSVAQSSSATSNWGLVATATGMLAVGFGWIFRRRKETARRKREEGSIPFQSVVPASNPAEAPAAPVQTPVSEQAPNPAEAPAAPAAIPAPAPAPDTPVPSADPVFAPVPALSEEASKSEALPEWLSDISETDPKKIARIAAFRKTKTLFVDDWKFSIDPNRSSSSKDYTGTLAYSQRVPTGSEFVTEISVSDGSVIVSTFCFDDGKTIFENSWGTPLPLEIGELDAFARNLENACEEFCRSALLARNAAKYEDFRNVQKFEVASEDLSKIYGQLEDPATSRSNRETGGHWFSSPYLVSRWTFRFEGLALPKDHEIDSSSVEFGIRESASQTYVLPNISHARNRLFSRFETYFERKFRTPLTAFLFNWHKHPGAPLSPSQGDLNSPNATPLVFELAPGMGAMTYAIANRIDRFSSLTSLKPGTFLVLKGNEFGGERDYVFTFWKVLRILEEEKTRRNEAVEKIGFARARSFWLVSSDGRLLHLHREIRIENVGTFGPDLVPVEVARID